MQLFIYLSICLFIYGNEAAFANLEENFIQFKDADVTHRFPFLAFEFHDITGVRRCTDAREYLLFLFLQRNM